MSFLRQSRFWEAVVLVIVGVILFMGTTSKPSKFFQETKILAEKGDLTAQYNLGVLYDEGEGVAKDEIEAYAYFNLAGSRNEDARNELARLEAKLTPEARLKGQQRAKELQKEMEARNASKKD